MFVIFLSSRISAAVDLCPGAGLHSLLDSLQRHVSLVRWANVQINNIYTHRYSRLFVQVHKENKETQSTLTFGFILK